ncbi:MAG: flavodoxin [Firmicutes bacterium HGW-Firmicutes-12]|jgi:hypothetical protein|nr:MAG: flavodoxin [Firmicutes bacterium HGW-Firmicutes-12]
MKNVVFISASPKIKEKSVSEYLVKLAADKFTGDVDKAFINVRQSINKHQTLEDFEKISQADALIIAFPLYVFCLPGILMRYLEDFHKFYSDKEKFINNKLKIYALVNCGFPEPGINQEAVGVIRSFSRHMGADFRFGVLIGSGGMLLQAKDAPFMKKATKEMNKAFDTIAMDCQNDNNVSVRDLLISVKFPRRLYLFMGDRGWISVARKYGLKKKDLYRKPYSIEEAYNSGNPI